MEKRTNIPLRKMEFVRMNAHDIPMGEYHKKYYYDDMLHS